MKNTAGILVDYQNDFANPDTGTLYVRGGEKISSAINNSCNEIKSKGGIILTSRELHPKGHISFASSFIGKEPITESFKRGESPTSKNFITLDEVRRGIILSKEAKFTKEQLIAFLEKEGTQVLWPDHCVDGTFGAEFYKDFDTSLVDIEVKKGFEIDKHPFSAFGGYSMDSKKTTFELLREKGIRVLRVMGLATDYCDLATVMDGVNEGFQVEFDLNASAGVDPAGVVDALNKMRNAGVKILD